jgi:thioesterase domain-containing protein/acyl carrier protein
MGHPSEAASGEAPDPPSDPLETRLAELWAQVLELDAPVGRDEDFFELGGDSLRLAGLVSMVESEFKIQVPTASLLERITVRSVADIILHRGDVGTRETIVPFNVSGRRPRLFWAHGVDGGVFGARALARSLGVDQPLFAIAGKAGDRRTRPPTDLPAMASRYVELVAEAQPSGPYHLGGYSYGGFLAFEMALQLEDMGKEVGLLLIGDSKIERPPSRRRRLRQAAARLARSIGLDRSAGPELRPGQAWEARPTDSRGFYLQAARSYRLRPYRGSAVYVLPRGEPAPESVAEWRRTILGGLTVTEVPGDHTSMFEQPDVALFANVIREHLDRVSGIGPGRRLGRQDRD